MSSVRPPFFMPVALLVLAACSSPPPIHTATAVDLERFMGDWYVIANIPTFIEKGADNAVESYELNPDGSIAKALPHGIAGRIDAHLPAAGPPTVFSRYGNIIPLCLAGMLILLSFVANRRRPR